MIVLGQSAIEIAFAGKSAEEQVVCQYHYIWLRDNCFCNECTHPDTQERLVVTSEIADDIAPSSAKIEGDQLLIEWNQQQHQSRYSLEWLQRHSYSKSQFSDDLALGEPKLWGRELESSIPCFNYQELYDEPSVLLKWCEAVRDYGLTIVRDAPLKEAEIERFAAFVAVVRETVFDRLHNVKATPGEYNAYNVASTTLELKPHTDMPCYNSPPGVQMFHFLVNETQGGESTAVDGFYVAAQLKQANPQAYQILTTTPVNFRMYSARGDIESPNPILSLDVHGQLKVFRFSNQLARTMNLPAEQMSDFYDAYRALGKLIESPNNKIQFRLGTGDMMVTNNLRVMHGRNAYEVSSGERHLQLSYMDMDDVLSRIRLLKKAQLAAAAGVAE